MDEALSLPPLFTPSPLAGGAVPLREARAVAESDESIGRLFYAQRPDRLEAALILAPERTLRAALPVLYPLHLGLCDALGALLPPQNAVQFGWPDQIFLNGALCGAVTLQAPSDDLKAKVDWMLVGLTLNVMGQPGDLDPGRDRENTSLHEEGAADLAPGPIIEAFARHFLAWLNLWEDQGLASLWAPWSGRALGHDEAAVFDGPKGRITGRIDGITADGNLRVKTAKGLRSLPLRHVLDGRGWSAAGGA